MGFVKSLTIPNTYKDSVFLMKVSGKARSSEGVRMVSAMMASPRNKELMRKSGLGTDGLEKAQSDDLVVAVDGETEPAVDAALVAVQLLLNDARGQESSKSAMAEKPGRLEQVVQTFKPNMALISVAGDYAGYEAAKALSHGLNVMIYSDNISRETELRLKKMADARGLIVMGPDCGTSIIQNIPFGFANQVRRGCIGVVGASGTGIQEVTCLVDAMGEGISHAIGTGGRDLHDDIGGLSALRAMEYLLDDEETKVLTLISKPPGSAVREKLCTLFRRAGKKIIVHYVGAEDYAPERAAGAFAASTLEDAAAQAVSRARENRAGGPTIDDAAAYGALLEKTTRCLSGEQKGKYLRGIFGGGTLCYEALVIMKKAHPEDQLQSNLSFRGVSPLKSGKCPAHTFVDMGDDEFTVGRPHPMIDPDLKNARIKEAVSDPDVAVVLFDNVIGFGSHPDPAGTAVQAVLAGRALRGGSKAVVVASVCGTDSDRPSRREQVEKLLAADVVVLPSNAQAARFASDLVKGMKGMKI